MIAVVDLHKELWKIEMRCREREYRQRLAARDARRKLAGEAERLVADRLERMGYVVRIPRAESRFDLLVGGCCRIEVKAATWRPVFGGGSGRYEWHYHNDADLLILAARNGSWHFYVLPTAALGGRRNVAVWRENPAQSAGWLSEYLERWELVGPVVDQVGRERAGQLPLFNKSVLTCQDN